MKKINENKNCNFSEIKHIPSKSITKLHKKMLGKFKMEICCLKYKDYEKVVCFCYDNDVFELNQNPPINRPLMRKEFKAEDANRVCFKGEKVEGLIKALDKKLILSKICPQIHVL